MAALICGLLAVLPAEAGLVGLEQKARTGLGDALEGNRDFVRIHAAEAWIALGEKEMIHRAFLADADADDVRYRIGVWRVLAGSAPSSEAAELWVRRIEGMLDDPDNPQRMLAIESLNKLGAVIVAGRRAAIERQLAGTPEAGLIFWRWAECLAGERGALADITRALEAPEPAARLRAAYALRYLRPAGAAVRVRLGKALQLEPAGSTTRAFMLSAALTLDADPALRPAWRTELEQALAAGPDAVRYEASQTLMTLYGCEDLPRLGRLLAGASGDAQVGLAWAILHVLAGSGPAGRE